ncbi:hypothetical protein QR680_016205 [Steinernema hermaphroditum]|uniref:Uncharacterized protein n=1 Tax=Steinernema hermaphroditum TaxID=289476 RepID=A0AA39HBD3_9BILA|nr:hypothetical protein QR680_016205 [Steinernema hermaphroditum]
MILKKAPGWYFIVAVTIRQNSLPIRRNLGSTIHGITANVPVVDGIVKELPVQGIIAIMATLLRTVALRIHSVTTVIAGIPTVGGVVGNLGLPNIIGEVTEMTTIATTAGSTGSTGFTGS